MPDIHEHPRQQVGAGHKGCEIGMIAGPVRPAAFHAEPVYGGRTGLRGKRHV